MNNIEQKMAVVTGGAGFVGSHLVELLLAKGYKVKCIVRKSTNLQWLENLPVELNYDGLMDIEKLRLALADADYVYHIAGTVKSKQPQGYYDGNVLTTKNILEASLGNSKIQKILVTSSLAASGPAPTNGTMTETSPIVPNGIYGKSKWEQEQLAQSYMDRLPIVIVRPPAVYGQRDTEIFAVFKAVSRGIRPKIGLFSKRASMIHAKDLVNGMYLAAESPKAIGQTYFLSSEQAYDWKNLTQTAAKILNKSLFPLFLPHTLLYLAGGLGSLVAKLFNVDMGIDWERAQRITKSDWVCTPQKAMDELGFKEQLSIEQGLKETMEWYKEKKWL